MKLKMYLWLIAVPFVCVSTVHANQPVSAEQLAIDEFKNCVEQEVLNGTNNAETLELNCSNSKANLDDVLPGMSGLIIHDLLNAAQ